MRIKNPQTGQEMELINNQWLPVPPPSTAERVQRTIKNTAKEARKEPVEFDVGTMVSNIPSSAGQMASDIYSAVSSPIETAKGLGTLIKGTVEKGAHELAGALPEGLLTMGRPESGVMRRPVWGDEPVAEAAGEALSQRYGGLNELKTTAMEDPVGILGDVAGVTAGVGMLPKMGALGQMGSMLDPINLATKGLGKGIMNLPGVQGVPEALYQSSAKFGSKVDADAVTQTALERGITPTDTGMAKAQRTVDVIDEKITAMIEESASSGEKIPRAAMYQYIDELKQDMGGFNLDAPENLKKIDSIIDSFEGHMRGKGKTAVTAAEVQKFKQDIYKTINYKAQQGTGSQAGKNTRKAIARAAKDELERVIPEIKGLNMEMGSVLELMDAIEAPAKRIRNRDILGLGTAAKATAGGVAGGPGGALAGFLIGIADSPTLKANIAIGLNKIKKMKVSDSKKRVLAIELLRASGSQEEEQL